MIAITFALPQESSGVTKNLRNEIAAGKVRLFHTGVGEERSRRRMAEFLVEPSPSIVIAAGFAGALTEQFAIGDLVVGANYSDPKLLAQVEALIPNARPATLLTAPFVVHAPDQREALARSTGADVVDMETKFISAACAACGIPLLSLRVVSDTAAESFPAPPEVLFNVRSQRTELTRLFPYLLGNPGAIPRLIHFGSRVGKIRWCLADAVALVAREFVR